MTAEAITARLTELARLSRSERAPPSVDMSPAAVTRRLEELAALCTLCDELVAIGRAHRARVTSGR